MGMGELENKNEKATIQGFGKKLEETYGIKMDEQDARESFSNFSGFISTLIDIDKAMRASSHNAGQ
jgi:hypothetical protein